MPAVRSLALALILAGLVAVPAATLAADATDAPQPVRSQALGQPWHGHLLHGVQLPESGPGFITWDDVRGRSPNRPGRRWGTDRLVALVERVAAELQAAHPDAAPLLIGDLSRPHGGPFGKSYGGLGHDSHQNGLDVDVYYPRRDGVPRGAWRPSQVDRELSQELVDRFVAAGAQRIFVGPRVGLKGPRRIVSALIHHDDHLHVRIRPPPRPR